MMKYRDHSVRRVERTIKPVKARKIRDQTTTDINDGGPFVNRHNHSLEPLINVHDSESKIQKLKDGLGTAAHAGAHITATHVMPTLKHHAKRATTHMWAQSQKLYPGFRAFMKQPKSKQFAAYRNILFFSILCLLGYYVVTHNTMQPFSATSSGGQSQSTGGTIPNYETLLPAGTTIEKLGGWNRVSPPDSNPVFAYVDTLDRIQISVSQQPLPDGFSRNPDKEVRDLAQSFNANDRHVADDATVYFLGTSAKGPQSVILVKKATLILIKAPTQIKVNSWSRYIASLG